MVPYYINTTFVQILSMVEVKVRSDGPQGQSQLLTSDTSVIPWANFRVCYLGSFKNILFLPSSPCRLWPNV